MSIPESQIAKLGLGDCLARFEGVPVVVLGDLMLDEFVWGSVRRISPEAPVPVVEVESQTYRPGGAANVAANIVALGGVPRTVGIVGNDSAGGRLKALLSERGVGTRHVVDTSRRTTLKTRIIAHNQQVVRADREDRSPLDHEIVDRIAAEFASAIAGARAVVVSDYDKGVIDPALLGRILPLAEGAGVPVFLDPKVAHADSYRPVTMITPNQREAGELSGIPFRDTESLLEAGKALLARFGCPYVLVTRGEDGMTLFGETEVHQIPATAREVFDVTGAGDTVIATLALAGASGASMIEAARLANYAAGIAVGKVGTATVSRSEIAATLLAR
jgi:D-beta-D-heptose 7-phosphate kinase/D-beta-D-heptose 1-phosphate adenosyltransferase